MRKADFRHSRSGPESALLLLLLLPCLSVAAEDSDPSLFRRQAFGSATLDGWRVIGCEATIENENLVIKESRGLIVSEHRYGDFEFQWECRPLRKGRGDSGVCFRFEMPEGGQPWPQQYQVDLLEDHEGDLVGHPDCRAENLIKKGQWNQFLLSVRGSQASLKINNKPAWKTDAIKVPSGHLGIQVEVPEGGRFELRNLSITEIGFQSMFNGSDLTGWEGAGGDATTSWTVEDALLTCTGRKGPWLRFKQQVGDFNMRLEYKLKPGGNSGVYVRVPADGDHHGKDAGVEIQVLDDSADRYKNLKPYQFSASVYAVVPAAPRVTRPANRWNTLEIDCRGTSYKITHNGHLVVNADETKVPHLKDRLTAGYLGLQNHRENLWFRNLRIGPSQQ